MQKMNRLTAYDSSDSPMITWKVRGRSSSHTPEAASTPMASVRIELHQACRRLGTRHAAWCRSPTCWRWLRSD